MVYLVMKVASNLALAEILFASTNPTLMKNFMSCITVRPFLHGIQNLLFHPFDLSIEFTSPALSLLGMHFCVWQDQLALLIIFQLWYAYDHDETMCLFYVQHHNACDSLYAIYSKTRASTQKNLLKHHMKDKGLQWPKATRLSALRRKLLKAFLLDKAQQCDVKTERIELV